MNMKQVWGLAGGFFFVYVLITLTNRPQVTPRDSAVPGAPENVAGAPEGRREDASRESSSRQNERPSAAQLGMVRGFSYMPEDAAAFGPALDAVLDRIQQAGGEWLTLGPTFYVDKHNDLVVVADDRKTVSPQALAEAVGRCHARGLKVMVRPIVVSRDGQPTLKVAPNTYQLTSWFTSYAELVSPYFSAANEAKAEVFCVAAGLPLMDRFLPWTQLIDKARLNYNGLLTFGALTVDYPNVGGYRQITFWKKLDFIGIEGYLPSTDWAQFARELDEFRTAEGLQQVPVLMTQLSPVPMPEVDANMAATPSPLSQTEGARNLVEALFSRPGFQGAFLGGAFPGADDSTAFSSEALGLVRQGWGGKQP